MSRRFDNFSARLAGGVTPSPEVDPDRPDDAPDKPAPAPTPEPETPPEKEEPMPEDTPVEQTEAYQAGFKAANARMSSVFASEHFAGREAHAAKLLGKNMSADDIVDVLADMPKVQQVSQAEANKAAEDAARAEMKGALNTNNTDLGSDTDPDAKSGRAHADAVWDRANAKIEARKGV